MEKSHLYAASLGASYKALAEPKEPGFKFLSDAALSRCE